MFKFRVLAPQLVWVHGDAEMVYEVGPKGTFTLPEDIQNPKKWSLCSGHTGLQRILMKDELKNVR